MTGKGAGKFPPFGMKRKGSGKQPPFDPLKGKGKSGSGKSAPTAIKGRGKERPRCWKCGQHGHMSKDCKKVAAVYDESQEEEYEYDEEADWTDWTDWTGAVTYDVTVITVTTTRTHTGLKTPTGGLMVGMTTELGRQMLLPLCLQHRHRLSLDHRPALQ